MKNLMWRLYLVAAFAGLVWFGRATPAGAAEDGGGPGERLERLERRLNEMAERQEQMMRTLGAQMQNQGPMGRPGGDNFRPPMGMPGGGNFQQPMPSPGGPGMMVPRPGAAQPMKGLRDLVGFLFLIGFICNILMAIWIYTDIRKRGEGSNIFVAMALVAGVPAALIYAVTRIGDRRTWEAAK
jgi:hypothetical protein